MYIIYHVLLSLYIYNIQTNLFCDEWDGIANPESSSYGWKIPEVSSDHLPASHVRLPGCKWLNKFYAELRKDNN